MRNYFPIRSQAQIHRGFTLVEMLVAVALVVLMMSMFASIFQIAAGSMTRQKGMAENDQRARIIVNVLKGDLDKRTFRFMAPLANGMDPWDPPHQKGYFYYSENDPNNDTDDVLQWTVDAGIVVRNTDKTPYYGRATTLVPVAAQNGNAPYGQTYSAQAFLLAHPDQPEADDGQVIINNTATSNQAEVVYFLRNGNLYRRVMLIRNPYATISSNLDVQPQDSLSPANALIGAAYSNALTPTGAGFGNGSFYQDFDFSAYEDVGGVHFIAPRDLDNHWDPTTFSAINGTPPSEPNSIAYPAFRFGHNRDRTSPLPIEYAGGTFIGRFTQEETSHTAFTYPRNAWPARSTVALWGTTHSMPYNTTLSVGTDGVVSSYSGGPRRAEDLLLSNVHAFDVKIFDGAYNTSTVSSTGADGAWGRAGVDDDHNGTTDDFPEAGWPNSDDGDFADLGYAGQSATPGHYSYQAWANTSYFSRVSASGTTWPVFDTWCSSMPQGGGVTSLPVAPPFRHVAYGRDGAPGRINVDDDRDGNIDFLAGGTPDPEELGFPGTDDIQFPVRALQIRIRFLDTASGQLREVTLVHSFNDKR